MHANWITRGVLATTKPIIMCMHVFPKKAKWSDKLVIRDTARLDKSATKFVSKLDKKFQALEAELNARTATPNYRYEGYTNLISQDP